MKRGNDICLIMRGFFLFEHTIVLHRDTLILIPFDQYCSQYNRYINTYDNNKHMA